MTNLQHAQNSDCVNHVHAQLAAIEADFKAAMRSLAANVNVITTRDDGGSPHGMAATSVISVSMQPASMLIAVNGTASINPVLRDNPLFCVNILREEHKGIVELFSSSQRRDQRFQTLDWQRGYRDLPYLATARASIFCEVDATLSYGTHTLYVGKVMDIHCTGENAPLLWFDGSHARVERI